MTKETLAEALQGSQDIASKAEALRITNAVFMIIQSALLGGQEVSITGFGIFRVINSPARKGRNPKTGEAVDIPASKKPKFRAGKGLKDAVNSK